MMSELIEASRSGVLRIRFGGSDATVGPAHPFNRWITGMLSAIEGIEGTSVEEASLDPVGTLSLVRVAGSRVTESVWLSSDNRGVKDWIGAIESLEADGSVSSSEVSSGGMEDEDSIIALVDRDMAEHQRLHGVRIRRLYVKMRWLEDNPGIPEAEEKIERIRQRITRLEDEPAPPAASVELVHQFRALGA
jgi:hypothetical protein